MGNDNSEHCAAIHELASPFFKGATKKNIYYVSYSLEYELYCMVEVSDEAMLEMGTVN